MEERLGFVCPDCEEEFSIGALFAADPERLLLCPCCGSTDVKRVSDQRLSFAARADAA